MTASSDRSVGPRAPCCSEFRRHREQGRAWTSLSLVERKGTLVGELDLELPNDESMLNSATVPAANESRKRDNIARGSW